jgi:hypothetical protein
MPQDRGKWCVLFNTVMDLVDTWNVRNIFTAEELLASQAVLCFVELLGYLFICVRLFDAAGTSEQVWWLPSSYWNRLRTVHTVWGICQETDCQREPLCCRHWVPTRAIEVGGLLCQHTMSEKLIEHSGRQCRSEEEADMWFLGQILHAVEFANPVSCIHSSKNCRMCKQYILNVCG